MQRRQTWLLSAGTASVASAKLRVSSPTRERLSSTQSGVQTPTRPGYPHACPQPGLFTDPMPSPCAPRGAGPRARARGQGVGATCEASKPQ